MTKDYYKILDIPEFSTQEEIKSAYRKLARKWHPDVAGNSDDVIFHFKEINEAYEILSNTMKKRDYDNARKFYNWGKGNTVNDQTKQTQESKGEKGYSTQPDKKPEKHQKSSDNKSHKKSGFSFNWEEFISKQHAESLFKKEKNNCTPKNGDNIYTEIDISVFEAINGTTKIVNMLQTQICPKCGGRKFVNGNKCTHCSGKGDVSEYKRFSVKIPAGIKDGSKIRLAGEGEKGENGGRNGDLYIKVRIKEPQNYSTKGLNILKNIEISPSEAVLGTELKVATMEGNVIVNIAPNTKSGQKIRLKNCGIKKGNEQGDMILTLYIQIPEKLSNEEIELYKKLQSISSKLF